MDKALIERVAFGSADTSDLESLGAENVYAIKADPEVTHYRFVPSEDITKAMDEETRSAEWVASDESTDSMGDVIRVAGWDLDRFRANPVLLWAHKQDQLPLGLVPGIGAQERDAGPALVARGMFYDQDVNPMAGHVWRIMQKGGLPGVSVGFRAKDTHNPRDAAERAEIGLGDWGVEFRGQELMELSVVPVPANANALRVRCAEVQRQTIGEWLKSGAISPADARDLQDVLGRESRPLAVQVPDMATIRVRAAAEVAVANNRTHCQTTEYLLGRVRTLEAELAQRKAREKTASPTCNNSGDKRDGSAPDPAPPTPQRRSVSDWFATGHKP